MKITQDYGDGQKDISSNVHLLIKFLCWVESEQGITAFNSSLTTSYGIQLASHGHLYQWECNIGSMPY